jgi:hypothetical protein
MIDKFVNRWEKNKDKLRNHFAKNHKYYSYSEIFKLICKLVLTENTDDEGCPDPERITVINHGDYQGTLILVVGSCGYQPDNYWATKVYYGSCSGCDTLQHILAYSEESFNEQQINDLMTLSLHMVQKLKEI